MNFKVVKFMLDSHRMRHQVFISSLHKPVSKEHLKHHVKGKAFQLKVWPILINDLEISFGLRFLLVP
jgi:hypothetical protein